MKAKSLYSELETAKMILKQRIMMIPRYCDQSKTWNGKNHYSMDMIPDLQKRVDELEAALEGIRKWRASKTKLAKNMKQYAPLKSTWVR